MTVCNIALQFPLSMGFSRQEYWSELPCPLPGDLPDPGIEPAFPAAPTLQADSLPLSHWGSPMRLINAKNIHEFILTVNKRINKGIGYHINKCSRNEENINSPLENHSNNCYRKGPLMDVSGAKV